MLGPTRIQRAGKSIDLPARKVRSVLAALVLEPGATSSADRLVDLALRGGGPDNVTCIVADVVDRDAGGWGDDVPVIGGALDVNDGVDEVQGRFGEHILDVHLPEPGTPTQPVEAGYMANAWVRMVHPDYDVLRDMLDAVGQTLKVRAS